LLLLFLICIEGHTQEEKTPFRGPEIGGYVKYLTNATNLNIPLSQELLTNQIIHHRLNLKWDLHQNLVFHAGWRNQMFFGEQLKINPLFGKELKSAQKDFFSLSANIIDHRDILLNSTLDRFYLEYYWDNLEVSLGRQRVNWGINTIWNPNDIFNVYSFIDFDYEERPGSDAFIIRYYTGELSSIEIAGKYHSDKKKVVLGGLWKFNKSQYDFQVLLGYANGYWAMGSGWAGNLGNAGWKGEATWFLSDLQGLDNAFLITSAVDYSFQNNTYLSGGFLYNKNGSSSASITGLSEFNVSPQNIYPYKFALLITNGFQITPLITTSVTLVYTPNNNHPLFVSPAITYSIAQDWDLDFISQIGFEKGKNYYSPFQAFYLRTKWSY
jgi:hypothetical protein